MKHRLWDMSWMEAEDALKSSEIAILPVGTLHGHGPTPISIDSSSVEWLSEEVGKRERERILDWWNIAKQLMPDLHPEKGSFIQELAVSLAIGGKEIADLRGTGYKGEWGEKYTMRDLFGKEIKPQGFNNFQYKGGSIIIPVQAWDLDLEGPPILGKEVVDELYERGRKILDGLLDYLVDFIRELQKTDLSQALRSKD